MSGIIAHPHTEGLSSSSIWIDERYDLMEAVLVLSFVDVRAIPNLQSWYRLKSGVLEAASTLT